MSKIQLTIDPGYCGTWGAWEGVRELIANAKDAEDQDPRHAMEVEHSAKTSKLVIRTRNVTVDIASLLVLGKSDKRDGSVRGRFGEGFVIGCLALTRAGHPVTFRNHDRNWRCAFATPEDDHPLAGNDMLTFYSRSVTPTQDFELTIENITLATWAAMKELFLFLSPPDPIEVIKVDRDSLIMAPARKGMVFARGVFVRALEDLSFGYDLHDVPLDRDRRMIDEWTLQSRLTSMWVQATEANPRLSRQAYDLVKNDAEDVQHLRWRTDDTLIRRMKEHFVADHGDAAVPVETMTEARQVETLGSVPVVVNGALKELLSRAGLSLTAAKASLEGKITARFSPSQLTPEEKFVSRILEILGEDLAVVTFAGPASARKIDDKVIGVDRRLLADAPGALRAVARVAAERRGVEEGSVLAEALARTAASYNPTDVEAEKIAR